MTNKNWQHYPFLGSCKRSQRGSMGLKERSQLQDNRSKTIKLLQMFSYCSLGTQKSYFMLTMMIVMQLMPTPFNTVGRIYYKLSNQINALTSVESILQFCFFTVNFDVLFPSGFSPKAYILSSRMTHTYTHTHKSFRWKHTVCIVTFSLGLSALYSL